MRSIGENTIVGSDTIPPRGARITPSHARRRSPGCAHRPSCRAPRGSGIPWPLPCALDFSRAQSSNRPRPASPYQNTSACDASFPGTHRHRTGTPSVSCGARRGLSSQASLRCRPRCSQTWRTSRWLSPFALRRTSAWSWSGQGFLDGETLAFPNLLFI